MSAVKKPTTKKESDSTVGALLDQAAERMPAYANYINKAKPHVVTVCNFLDAMYPYLVKAYDFCLQLWAKLEPYNPQQFFPFIFGLVLCFFGGSYLTLVAAVEAVRMTTWDNMVKSAKVIHTNYQAAKEASAK
eukprot:236310_1